METGSTVTTCGGDCGEIIATTVIPIATHTFDDWTETKAPTCTEEGLETRNCNFGLHSETRPISALDHEYGSYSQTTAPTCTDPGVETSTCSRDSSHTQTRPIPALNPPNKTTVEATCTESDSITCDDCGVTFVGKSALGHDWHDWVETLAPTYTAEGTETRICGRDSSHVETRPIPKLDRPLTVTFYYNDGTGEKQQHSIQRNDTTDPIPPPERPGYTFLNWYADEACTMLFDFNTQITSDTEIWAKWNLDEKITNDWLKKNWWWLLIIALVIFFGTPAAIYLSPKKRQKSAKSNH
jgi:uncharacterized repeat protein (TIGR02543 family)